MNSYSLNGREKLEIDAILSQAEEEFLQGHDDPISKIDEECRSLWPDWNTTKMSSMGKQQSETLIKSPHEISEVSNINSKREFTDYDFYSNDDNKNSPIETINNNTIKNDDVKSMSTLREEVKHLMDRISNTVATPNMSPKSKQFISKIKNSQEKEKMKVTSNDQLEENIKTKKKTKSKRRIISSNAPLASDSVKSDNSPPRAYSISQKPKTSSQAKTVIASTVKQMKVIESENKTLRKRLADMEKTLVESQKEIKLLKEALQKSEAIRAKISQPVDSIIRAKRKVPNVIQA